LAAAPGIPSSPPPVASPAPALGPAAATCLASLQSIERQYNLAANPPRVPLNNGQASLSDQLAQSKGVLTPPATNDPAVIQPPNVDTTLPTTPPPDPGKAPVEGGLSAADRDFLEGVIIAGRSAAERDDGVGCASQVQTAQQFIATHAKPTAR
jgi:hypothetical protein